MALIGESVCFLSLVPHMMQKVCIGGFSLSSFDLESLSVPGSQFPRRTSSEEFDG